MAKFKANPFTKGKQELDKQAEAAGQDQVWYDDSSQQQADQQDEPGYKANKAYRTGR